MTATLPSAAVPRLGRGRRERLARLERPLLFAGLAREPRLQAVVADGPTRPMDGAEVNDPGAQLWELPDAGHTGGLRKHPAAYAQRTIAFLDDALDPKETP